MKYSVLEFMEGVLEKCMGCGKYIQRVNKLPLSNYTHINTSLNVEEIRDKIRNENWVVFPYSAKLIDIKPYMNTGFKVVFITKHFREFKKEYKEIM